MREIKKFEWDAKNLNVLSIHSISGDLSVESGNDKIEIEVELSGLKRDIEEYEPIFSSGNGRLEINLFPKKIFFNFFGLGDLQIQRAKVKVPDNISLDFETTSADMRFENLSLGDLRSSSISGDIQVNVKEAKNIFVKTTSGDITIHKLYPKIEFLDLQSISENKELMKTVGYNGDDIENFLSKIKEGTHE